MRSMAWIIWRKYGDCVKTERGRKMEKQEDIELKLELYDPFLYDGVEIREIDLVGIFDLVGLDMCELDRQMVVLGYTGSRPELTRQYAMLVAAKVNHKPQDFCNRMKSRDTVRLREMVAAFFYARG